MTGYRRDDSGFTIIEVTFATGILFLGLVLLLGALAQIAQLRDIGERRNLATICLNHCLEQLQNQPGVPIDAVQLAAPSSLPGSYDISVVPDGDEGLAVVTVVTHTTRGHVLQVSAVHAFEAADHAP